MSPTPKTSDVDSRLSPLVRSGFLAVLLGCAAGCVVIPTPEHTISGRANLGPQSMVSITVGQTRREEVILRFGEPDVASDNGRKVAYRWEKVKAYYAYIIGSGYSASAGAGPISKGYYLVIEFDEAGVVAYKELTHRLWSRTLPTALIQQIDGESIRFKVPAIWYPKREAGQGYKPKNWFKSEYFFGVQYVGELYSTDSTLYFRGRFGAQPGWLTASFRYDSLAECQSAKRFLGQRLLVRTKQGQVQTFDLLGRGKNDVQPACEMIQSKIKR